MLEKNPLVEVLREGRPVLLETPNDAARLEKEAARRGVHCMMKQTKVGNVVKWSLMPR